MAQKSLIAKRLQKRKLPTRHVLSLKRTKADRQQSKLPSVFSLVKQSAQHVWRYKKPFIGIMLIYILLILLFVKAGSEGLDVPSWREQVRQTITESKIQQDVILLGIVASTGPSASNEVGSLYQTIIVVVTVLAIIWLMRQTNDATDAVFKVKQPYYEGMGQIIPFLLVMFVVGIQLLPMLLGLGLYGTISNNGLAVNGVEIALLGAFTLGLTLLTLYFLASSLFATIIVTLPQSTPMAALRSARKIVKYRRWVIVRKLVGLVLLFAGVSLVCLFAVIALIPQAAEIFTIVLGAVITPLIIGSWYKLYRALL